jgi:hypothetical protein
MENNMKKRLIQLFVMLALVTVATAARPPVASACSGDDCGCGTIEQECLAACGPNNTSCRLACIHADIQCAIACCS